MNLDRRTFLGSTLGGLVAFPAVRTIGHPFEGPEPKSIHTWLESDKSQIYAYDVDVKITDFPTNADRKWLYYMSLQVNFTGHDEWSHGGIQWSGTKEFRDNNNKGINWGGGSDWAGYGGIGSTNTPFTWENGKWYRYRVWRLDKNDKNLWRWLFAVKDYESGVEKRYGTVVTKSKWIKSAVVFTETGYGVKCDTEKASVEWRNPIFRCTTPGEFKPTKGIATYNGTCEGSPSTDQQLISEKPLQWMHATAVSRKTKYGTRLW
ncbi:MAG: hypothetical protein HKN33_09230 [Pyrinomonadaceae bacterium]|nr:hypothetical protein [Pyrinomonadaceae bacterium]